MPDDLRVSHLHTVCSSCLHSEGSSSLPGLYQQCQPHAFVELPASGPLGSFMSTSSHLSLAAKSLILPLPLPPSIG